MYLPLLFSHRTNCWLFGSNCAIYIVLLHREHTADLNLVEKLVEHRLPQLLLLVITTSCPTATREQGHNGGFRFPKMHPGKGDCNLANKQCWNGEQNVSHNHHQPLVALLYHVGRDGLQMPSKKCRCATFPPIVCAETDLLFG